MFFYTAFQILFFLILLHINFNFYILQILLNVCDDFDSICLIFMRNLVNKVIPHFFDVKTKHRCFDLITNLSQYWICIWVRYKAETHFLTASFFQYILKFFNIYLHMNHCHF